MIAPLAYISLTAAFFILLISKMGLRDEVIARAPKLISEMFSCDFCLSFWTSLVLAIAMAIVLNKADILVIPVLSTPIIRSLL